MCGDKWSLLIIRDLMEAKECPYGDFLKLQEGIATNSWLAGYVMNAGQVLHLID
jgi:hypothetical protein